MRWFDRLTAVDRRATLAFNRMNHRPVPARLFAIVSRLGDGILWYGIILALPCVEGARAARVSLQMVTVGLLSYLLYRWIKRHTGRPRPCQIHDSILRSVAPLDEFSFPSGHTMHAVAFTIILLAYYPTWGLCVAPFTLLVALSRLVLGLHYPSDVLAGALIGSTMATLSVLLITTLGF